MAAAILFMISTYCFGQGLNGRVVDKNYQGIQGAQVKLIKADSSTTTNWEGRFFIDMTSTHVLPFNPVQNMITFHNGILSLNLSEGRKQVRIEVFDTKGQIISKSAEMVSSKGTLKSRILPEALPAATYFVRLQIENWSTVFQVMNLDNQKISMPGRGAFSEKSLKKRSAAQQQHLDTLEVSKDGYQTARVGIQDYTSYIPDIVLESETSNDDGEGLPPVVNGQQAGTTRYWDCCKPHCGWHSNMRMCDIHGNTLHDPNAQSSCEGGPAFQCMDYAPFAINGKVAYGWAAFNNPGSECGDCYQLDFQGALSGKQMIVQLINIGDGGQDAFDLLIPGGGVGQFNGCSRQWNNAPMGVQYGGFHATCGDNADCIRSMCEQAFGDKADLMGGCEWYLEWFEMSNNPDVVYKKVPCPQEIKNISNIGN